MLHQVEYDERNRIVKVTIQGGVLPDEVRQIHAFTTGLTRVHTPRFFLCDLTRARLGSLFPNQTRQAIADAVTETGYERVALVGDRAVLKVIIGIVRGLLGRNMPAELFASQDEALAWLKK